VRIILACTGIEAIVIFVGAIFATQMRRDPWADYKDPDQPRYARLRAMSPKERAMRAFLITTSVIWVGNLLRNVMIIFLVEEWGWDFDFVHSDIGKSMSFIILLVLAFVTFNLMPEMLDNIAGIASLVYRKSPEERRLEELKKQREEEEKGEGDASEEDGEGDKGPPVGAEDGSRGLDGDDAEEDDADEDGDDGVDLGSPVNP
jgi:exosortase/archaeosortase family protein